MNEIINWMALNNTLMIRIGFTAVIILIVLYVFRFFFVPKVSVVDVAETASSGGAAAGISVNIEELAELQAEIDTLKVKLKQSETEKNNLVNVNKATGTGAGAGVDMVASAGTPAPSAEETAKKAKIDEEMSEKLRMLEARLAEYEIIAEDIAEISKLRSENLELKSKLENIGTTQNFLEAEIAAEPEIKVEDGAAMESEPEAVAEPETAIEPEVAIGGESISEEISAAAPEPISHIVLESETPVTDEEKSILDEFEKFQKTKKG